MLLTTASATSGGRAELAFFQTMHGLPASPYDLVRRVQCPQRRKAQTSWCLQITKEGGLSRPRRQDHSPGTALVGLLTSRCDRCQCASVYISLGGMGGERTVCDNSVQLQSSFSPDHPIWLAAIARWACRIRLCRRCLPQSFQCAPLPPLPSHPSTRNRSLNNSRRQKSSPVRS